MTPGPERKIACGAAACTPAKAKVSDRDTSRSRRYGATTGASKMPKYVIEREIPGAGAMTGSDLQGASQKSCSVLNTLGPDIQWVQSYVTDNKIYCVYIAPSEDLIRQHAEQSGFPANSISAVRAVIDPTTSEQA
jgi:hypothetical protein